MVMMTGQSHQGPLPPLTAEETELRDRLRGHVEVLSEQIGERNTRNSRSLGEVAEYLKTTFGALGLTVREDTYLVEAKEAVNIEAQIRGSALPEEIVVIGAHYDSVPGSPGANDNASGVAAVLELARGLRDVRPLRTVRLVGFVNEEPPYFQSESMGSLVYASRAKERGEKIIAMLSIETIGYYSDQPKSQQYPSPLSRFYPDTGNFIGFVSDLGSLNFLRRVLGSFRKSTQFPSQGLAAPGGIPGIGWSDHWSFWQAGYPAIMITDTAPFRYPHYHDSSDTPDKLDYDRMARVVGGISKVVGDLAN